MPALQIATVGSSAAALLATLPESPFSRLLLVYEDRNEQAAREVADVVASLSRKVDLRPLPTVEVGAVVAELLVLLGRESEEWDRVVLNVASAEPPLCCAAAYAGLLAGLPVLGARDGHLLPFPGMVTPWWRFLSGPKERLLRLIFESGGRSTVKALATRAAMNSGTVAYHLRDPRNHRGLVDLGLARSTRERGAPAVELTPAGLVAILGAENERPGGTPRLPAELADVVRLVLPQATARRIPVPETPRRIDATRPAP